MSKPCPSILSRFGNKSSSGRGCSRQVFSSDAHSCFLQEQNEHVLRDHSPIGVLKDVAQCYTPHTWNLGLTRTNRSAGSEVCTQTSPDTGSHCPGPVLGQGHWSHKSQSSFHSFVTCCLMCH